MFERFTESARQVVVRAHDEARALGHGYIGTEHLLLGLFREGAEGVAGRALGDLGVSADAVRAQVAREVGVSDTEGGQLPFTPNAKKLLELALREALVLGHNYIGTEHILLAVVADADVPAARILAQFADLEAVRDAVVRTLSGSSRPPEQAAPTHGQVDRPALAALSDEELDELIDGLVDEEGRLLYEQGALQGKLDLLRSQREHRRGRQGGGLTSN